MLNTGTEWVLLDAGVPPLPNGAGAEIVFMVNLRNSESRKANTRHST